MIQFKLDFFGFIIFYNIHYVLNLTATRLCVESGSLLLSPASSGGFVSLNPFLLLFKLNFFSANKQNKTPLVNVWPVLSQVFGLVWT